MEHASQTEGRQTQPASAALRTKSAVMTNHSPGGDRLRGLAQLMNASPAVQRLQSVSDNIQRKEPEEEELVQAKNSAPVQTNRTGLPANLKSGIESLSGLSMDHVQVHRNSSRPAQLNAHAFAQGSDIHLAPGQDRHLPHEAWHVVQQAQGRVKPTMQLKGGVPVNDDAGLEREADVMGARAMVMPSSQRKPAQRMALSVSSAVQRKMEETDDGPHFENLPEHEKEPGLEKYSNDPFAKIAPDEKSKSKLRSQDRFEPLKSEALKRIDLAVRAAKDTIELVQKLEDIKLDLELSDINLEGVGTKAARVVFRINPTYYYNVPNSTEVWWKMLGTETTPVTEVYWSSDDLTIGTVSAKVGKIMHAQRLGPDHEPGSVSTSDSEQNGLMSELGNAGNTSVPNDQKYIKGHLLNDHVGGPGAAYNLFPITADANAKHLAYVEKFVKAQLQHRFVITYRIDVVHQPPKSLSQVGGKPFEINSRFDFQWQLLSITGSPVGTLHKNSIISDFNAKGAEPFDITQEYLGQYDKLNRGKTTPNPYVQSGQWQMNVNSPPMGAMGPPTNVQTPFPNFGTVSSSSGMTPSYPDFTEISVKKDSGLDYISVRNKDVGTLAKGDQIQIGNSSTPTVVTISAVDPLSGGWTRLYL
jgi:hypothetical protein